jgi:DNA-binding transcriptional ArsR family regulator
MVQTGAVRSLRDGNRLRFYLATDWKGHPEALGDPAEAVLEHVFRAPGLSHSELSASMGMEPTAVDYHAGRLVASGSITVRIEGRQRRYWIASPRISARSPDENESVHLHPESLSVRSHPVAEFRKGSGGPGAESSDKPSASGLKKHSAEAGTRRPKPSRTTR